MLPCNYFKQCINSCTDYVIPSHPVIGAIAGGVGYYTHALCMTYFPMYFVNTSRSQISNFFPANLEWVGNAVGYAVTPLYSTKLTPYLAEYICIGTAIATSLMLNLVAQRYFKIQIKLDGKGAKDLRQSLMEMGIAPNKIDDLLMSNQQSVKTAVDSIMVASQIVPNVKGQEISAETSVPKETSEVSSSVIKETKVDSIQKASEQVQQKISSGVELATSKLQNNTEVSDAPRKPLDVEKWRKKHEFFGDKSRSLPWWKKLCYIFG